MEVWLLWSKIILTKGCRLVLCQAQMLIWLQYFAYPEDPKGPYRMGPPRVSSVRNLLKNVGDLRDIAILVHSNISIFDIYWSVLKLVKLSRIIIFYFWLLGNCFLKSLKKNLDAYIVYSTYIFASKLKLFLDAYVVDPVFSRSSALDFNPTWLCNPRILFN